MNRISNHLRSEKRDKFDSFSWFHCLEKDMLYIEKYLISAFKPKLNIRLHDDMFLTKIENSLNISRCRARMIRDEIIKKRC